MPRPFETLEDATGYLDGLINRERQTDYAYRRLDLEPIRALLEGLGRPDASLSIIHVAGSKGKGSTCLFAESILRALGESVGTFTSPHLVSWVERFRINGEPISDATLIGAVEQVRPIVEALCVGPVETRPSFFDATTAVALLVFAAAEVDRVLLEVGLGGRLDSTNIVDPVVTCISSIELEHTDKLGETETEIAREKAGILKPGIPAIVGWLRPEAMTSVEKSAAAAGAPITALPERLAIESSTNAPGVTRFRFVDDFEVETALATPGAVARQNAALALACVRALDAYPGDELQRAATDGLANCRLPGRMEILASDPAVLVDAAHTERSAIALAAELTELAQDGFDLLVSVSADKQLDAFLAPLLVRVRCVWATCADPVRSLPADLLAKRVSLLARELGRSIDVEAIADPVVAARRARESLAPNYRLVAAGSVYLAGVARRVLGESGGE